MRPDVIVIGAGSGGGVVSARLTEDPRVNVLLLEAGPDTWPDVPDEVLHVRGGSGVEQLDWHYGDPSIGAVLPRGRLVGGSSAVNASYALRGQPADYDGWGPGWSWRECLPYFNRLENDADFGDKPYHGRGGPVHIERLPADSPVEESFMAACMELGHERLPDLNQPDGLGVGRLPRNMKNGVRQSTLVTYLAAARGRPNLEIRGGALVDRLLFEADRVVGVALASGEEIRAPRIVLAAGAYNSPQVLLRSGVGDSSELRRHDIGTRLELPQVGRHLTDHPLTVFVIQVEGGRPADKVRVGPTVKLRSRPDLPADDMKITLFPDGEIINLPGLTGLHIEIDETYSEGVVELRSKKPDDAPRIDSRLVTDPRDREKYLWGAAHMIEIFDAMRDGTGAEILLPDDATAHDAEQLHEYAMTHYSTAYHPSGTCRIGHVVDERCRLLGAKGLWIADASVMPTVPRANTNLPTLMIGERVADFVKSDL